MSVKYKSGSLSVVESVVRANGRRFNLVSIRLPDVVVALAMVDGRIVMERQRRHVVRKTIVEAPAGKVKPGESAANAAIRELGEETGYRASRARFLFSSYMAPGLYTRVHHYFLLTGVRKGTAHRDPDEEIKVFLMDPKRALSMVSQGRIKDGKTALLLLWAARKGLIKP